MSRTARNRKETPAQAVERVLAEAGHLLASSLDYEETLATVAELAVRSLADFCIIDIMEDGELKRLQVAHADPEMRQLTEQLLRFPPDRQRGHLSEKAIDLMEAVLIPEVTAAQLDALAQNEEHRAILTALRPRSLMAVPLLARNHVLGAVLFAASERGFDAKDLELGVKLVHLAALEVDNARLYREARRALEARDRVLGIVAHDLRNPLNVIVMGGELLLDDCLPESRRDEQIRVILRSAKRMNRLIQDLLDVARIEADRLYLQREPRDPVRLAREAVELNAALAAAKSLSLSLCPCDTVPLVLADRDRILQVLSNLIGNAIKFSPEGGTIEVRVQRSDEGAHVTVADTGFGISPAELGQLFQPFWQSRQTSIEGAGLGLMIARGIVEAHGGRIWAESVHGEGSTFHFTIPTALQPLEERRRGVDRRSARRTDTAVTTG